MSINWDLVVQLGWPIVLLFIGALLNHLLEKRERIVAYLSHVSSFRLETNAPDAEPIWVYTHSVVVRNSGRKAATNVRLGHNVLPNVNVTPDIQYEMRELPSGGKEIVIPNLVPKKEITISYLYYPPTTWNQINTHLETDEGPIKVVRVMPQIQAPTWVLRCIWALIIIGVISLAYAAVELVQRVAT
ncbi:Uncharacterised protein [Halioglobus japonicus]|nr:Uncharacterised protein [Halioglobus japonicus]